MPELPEVETVKRGIAPRCLQQRILNTTIRRHDLRWPIPADLATKTLNQTLKGLSRRGKYLLFEFTHGTMLIHLGMSGTLRLVPPETPLQKHDHAYFDFDNQLRLVFNDTRRFGAILWAQNPSQLSQISHLGVEPLSDAFTAKTLLNLQPNCKRAIKLVLMDAHIVVGIGNIYANEALFMAHIMPDRPFNTLTPQELEILVTSAKQVLTAAIQQGGTTLNDFMDSDGKPGYFTQRLNVYGRAGDACPNCQNPIAQTRLGQRATYFCTTCQL